LKLSVIIPVHNEESTIDEVLAKVFAVDIGYLEKEIIIVDDGSTDGSLEIVQRWHSDQADLLKVYASPVNFGKGAAVRYGFKFATGDIYLIQDADLELDPEEYCRLLEPILAGESDVVYGSRFKGIVGGKVPAKTRLANRFLTVLTNILFRSRLTDMETAYKVFRPTVLDGIKLKRVGFDFEPEITAKILKKRYKIREVPISYNPRTTYEGKRIGWKDGLDAIWTLFMCRFFDS
jgi:glycosyltransferase involved in cell wall biosynthesis